MIIEELEGWWDGRADWLALLGMKSRAYIQEDRGAAARAVEALGTGTEVALGTIQAEGGGESSGVHGIAATQIDDSDDDAEAWRGSGSSDISGGGCGGGVDVVVVVMTPAFLVVVEVVVVVVVVVRSSRAHLLGVLGLSIWWMMMMSRWCWRRCLRQ